MPGTCIEELTHDERRNNPTIDTQQRPKEKLMKRSGIAALLGITAICCAIPSLAQTDDTELRSRVSIEALMQRKLGSAQALIKGLALDDFKLIESEAQQLQLLSLDAGWNVIQTEEYARISGEFREAAKKIRKAGNEKNLDAAGLGYFQLPMTCIDCHRHVRNVEATKRK
jgi:hypothetical protein